MAVYEAGELGLQRLSGDFVRSSNLRPVLAAPHMPALDAPTWGLK
jgi:hypothetical protein